MSNFPHVGKRQRGTDRPSPLVGQPGVVAYRARPPHAISIKCMASAADAIDRSAKRLNTRYPTVATGSVGESPMQEAIENHEEAVEPKANVEAEVVDDESSAEPPQPAFTDAASATRWVKSLPLSNVSLAYQEILGQLHALTASPMGPR